MEIEERDRQLTEIVELLHPNPWHSEYPYVDSPEPPPTCGVTLTLGAGGPDPYSTECDLGPNHEAEKHEGPDPFGGEGRVTWKGGGSCAGDALPVSEVEFTP